MESKFEKLLKEALDNETFDFGGEEEGENTLDFGDGDVTDGGEEEGDVNDNDVIGDLLSLKDQIDGLLTKLGYEGEEGGEEEGGEEDLEDLGGEEDLEDLERESVEYEDVTGKEDELQKKSSMKVSSKTGDLDQETSKKEGQEKNYKFVKVNKPTPLKHKTTKGS